MLKKTRTNCRRNEALINTEAPCRRAQLILFVLSPNEKEGCTLISFQDIKHYMVKGIKDCSWLKCIGSYTKLILTINISLYQKT